MGAQLGFGGVALHIAARDPPRYRFFMSGVDCSPRQPIQKYRRHHRAIDLPLLIVDLSSRICRMDTGGRHGGIFFIPHGEACLAPLQPRTQSVP